MKHYILPTILFSMGFVLSITASSNTNTVSHEQKEQAKHWMQNQPVHFLENKGQMLDMDGKPVPFVLFKASAPGIDMYVTEKGLTYVFVKAEEEMAHPCPPEGREDSSPLGRLGGAENIQIEWSRIDMELKGAHIKKENIVKETPSLTDFNYFYPHCSDGLYGVKQYEKITIKDVYPGIDWVFYNSSDKGFKYDFVVNEGSDYKQIGLLYKSKTPIKINAKGELELFTQHGNITENVPISFLGGQEIPTQFIQHYKKSIKINNDNGYETSISFVLNSTIQQYSKSTLIIDPQLVWATLYGGNGLDGFTSIDADNSGNIFITGYTFSANFPLQNGGTFFQGSATGSDAIILKFDNAGNRIWVTFYGGTLGGEWAISINTDISGNLFVTGNTFSTNFPLQNAGTFFQACNGTNDVFILKFDNAGNRLWATCYGDTISDFGNSITTDGSGNVFVTGYTNSTNFPLQNAGTFFQGTYGGGGSFLGDAFILKFDNTGNRLWATYYGGSGDDFGNSIVTDGSGNVFVTGYTNSSNFPFQNAGTFFQGTNAGGDDVFLLKFDNAGNRLWATYYGGNGLDHGNSIATDGSGNVFVTGYTVSTNFPLQNAGTFFQGTNGGGDDAFILKFDNVGNQLWATYYGGSGNERNGDWSEKNIILDGCGNVYVSFHTNSTSITTLASCDVVGYYDANFNGGTYDQFLTLFSNTGTLLWATYFGGDGEDFRSPIAIDGNNNLFMAGEWFVGFPLGTPSTYPFTNPGGGAYYDATPRGKDDSFIAKFLFASCLCSVTSVNIIPQNVLCNGQCNGTATANAVGGTAPYTYSWNMIPVQTTQTATGLCAGVYSVTVTNATTISTTATVAITQPTIILLTTSSTTTACTASTGTATVNPSGGTPGYTYLWSTSPAQTTITATGLGVGNYTATVTDANGCTQTQTVTVTSNNALNINVSFTQTGCTINNGTATAVPVNGTAPYTYSWNNSQTAQIATGLALGNYTVTVTDINGCTQTQMVSVTQTPGPAVTASVSPNIITIGASTTLTASGGGVYNWSNGATASAVPVMPTITTIYCVIVTDSNGCTDSACITVNVEIPCAEIFVPNAFSPNNDGENDEFCLQAGIEYCIKELTIIIYDRWGEKVYKSTDKNFCWDGTYKSKKMNTAVFVYCLDTTLMSGEQVVKRGNVSLIK